MITVLEGKRMTCELDSLVEFTPVIQHGDSRRTAIEEWITSRAKPHEQDVNE